MTCQNDFTLPPDLMEAIAAQSRQGVPNVRNSYPRVIGTTNSSYNLLK